MRAAIIENGVVVNVAEASAAFAAASGWVLSDTASIGDTWDGHAFHNPVPDPAKVQVEGAGAIQQYLDETAQAHGYDGILSLCSYATSTNAKWAAEGKYGCSFRDACWGEGQQIETAAAAGNWPTAGAGQLPTVTDVLAAMPPADWPVA